MQCFFFTLVITVSDNVIPIYYYVFDIITRRSVYQSGKNMLIVAIIVVFEYRYIQALTFFK